MAAAHAAAVICRPSGAGGNDTRETWGSRPRLFICRRFRLRLRLRRDKPRLVPPVPKPRLLVCKE